jgi:hypothetical protein
MVGVLGAELVVFEVEFDLTEPKKNKIRKDF